MLVERRSIASGFFFLTTILSMGFFLLGGIREHSGNILFNILFVVEAVLLFMLFVAYPLVLVPLFFVEGVILMRREGIKFSNLLSLFLAALLIFFDIFYPMIFDVSRPGPSMYFYWYMTLLSLYLLLQLLSFFLSNILNLVHIRKNLGLSYVVVLGAGLRGEEPTPLLRSRIEKGIQAYKNNPGSKIIFSGGQGSDELLPESHAMANYALGQGIPEEDILREDRSRNTEENIRFSAEIMRKAEMGPKGSALPLFAIATSDYHVMRSLMIARRLKLACIGYGARTKLYFSLNAFIREYIGYLRDTRGRRAIGLILITAVYLLFLSRQ